MEHRTPCVREAASWRPGMPIPLARPSITAREREAVLDVLSSGRLSLGDRVPQFEDAFRRYLGVRHAVAVSSGTAGLQLAVRALGLAEGDEVITTPFTFIATASVLCPEGLRPVFCDIDPETLNIDPERVAACITPRTRALMVVHIFGLAADMAPLEATARAHGLRVVEDACEALGATYAGRKAGTFGESGVFGFYPNKQITTAEGGIIATDDDALAARFRSLRNHGRGGKPMHFEEVGFNFRLNEFAAALGKAQLDRIEDILAARRARVAWYREVLGDIDDLSCMPGEPHRSPFIFYVRAGSRALRDLIARRLGAEGIESAVYFPPLHLERAFAPLGHRPGDFPVSEDAADRLLALPFWTDMPREAVDAVAGTVREALAGRR